MSFHVTEMARDLNHPTHWSTSADGNNGVFHLESVEPGWRLMVLASDGGGWEHTSVSANRGDKQRTPTWKEMCYVKKLFWDDEDVVVQFQPRASEYVNFHPNVLHMWRPTEAAIPTPPPLFVGPYEPPQSADAVVTPAGVISE